MLSKPKTTSCLEAVKKIDLRNKKIEVFLIFKNHWRAKAIPKVSVWIRKVRELNKRKSPLENSGLSQSEEAEGGVGGFCLVTSRQNIIVNAESIIKSRF